MDTEEAKQLVGEKVQFYSSGTGFVAWLDEGWHDATIAFVDESVPCIKVQSGRIGIDVSGEEDIKTLLRKV